MPSTSPGSTNDPKSPKDDTVRQFPRQRDGAEDRSQPIPGMKAGWYYRPADRAILHQAAKGEPSVVVGIVPRITGVVAHYTDDGEDIRTEIQVVGRGRRRRILTEDELNRGTWAAKVGTRQPSSADARQAFATIIRREADHAPEIPARTYYDTAGSLVLPDADAQPFGYLVCAGTEENARDVWDEIGAWAAFDPHAALSLGAMFVGPVLDALDVHAHIVNLYGPGQQGKSTALTVCAATLGDIKPRRQKLLMTWNASKQGITQGLRMRGYLPVALDEHSSSGRTPKAAGPEFSQIVAGAVREMGGAEGTVRESDGFWHSVLLSSSNEQLRVQGQVEALASRLQEIGTPFFQNAWVDADGNPCDAADGGAEHLSKRLKRLAKSAGGWPLRWAVDMGMFSAENLAALKRRHLELCAKHSPREGGIPTTIAELHMAWAVGAYMLGAAIGGDVEEALSEMAEQAAVARLQLAITDAAEANVTDGERLWQALQSVRVDATSFPYFEEVAKAAADPFRVVKGFVRDSEWWVLDSVVRQAAREYEVENLMQALRQLDDAGVHERGDGKHAQRQVPRSLWGHREIPKRMHLFHLDTADAVFSGAQEGVSVEGVPITSPAVPTPVPTPYPPQVGTRITPLTSGVPTVPTVPTLSDASIPVREEPTPVGTHSTVLQRGPIGTGIARLYPSPRVAVTDAAFDAIASQARGWTRAGVAFGVLGADPETGPVLWLPNCAPVRLPLPGTVNDVPALMDAYGLKTLWIHQSAALAMSLPTYDQRKGLPILGNDEDQDDDDQDDAPVPAHGARVGPQTPAAHSWAAVDPAGSITELAPGGLASWLTLVLPDPADRDKTRRLSVALPMYDDRYDKDFQRGGFGGAKDAAELLDALMVWTVATAYTRRGRTEVIPFYASVNRTAIDFASRGYKREERETDVLCQAVREQQIPPLLRNSVPLMVPQQWGRVLTPEEAGWAAIHRFDKTAAWLSAYSNCPLGIGEPAHALGYVPYDPKAPGFWRVADVPGTGPEGLPELRFREADEGGYWVSTPSMNLLLEIYPQWTPEVVEAWYWPESKRALEGMYTKVRATREAIVTAIDAGRPGGRWAKQICGRIYQSFRGYMSRVDGPMTDRATGGDYVKDLYYRPDWARLIMDLATANMYRNLIKFRADRVTALAVCVDAITFASPHADPAAARPASMVTGTARWTHEGSAPIAELLDALQTPQLGRAATAHHALNAYLDTPGA